LPRAGGSAAPGSRQRRPATKPPHFKDLYAARDKSAIDGACPDRGRELYAFENHKTPGRPSTLRGRP
jgi:hypothetical protein